MRHRAIFQTDLSLGETSTWFCLELEKVGFVSVEPVNVSKYDHEIIVSINDEIFRFSIFVNTNTNKSVCLYIKPKLKFLEALFRKSDKKREFATVHAHSILSNSTAISNLGWYNETQVWRGPSNNP